MRLVRRLLARRDCCRLLEPPVLDGTCVRDGRSRATVASDPIVCDCEVRDEPWGRVMCARSWLRSVVLGLAGCLAAGSSALAQAEPEPGLHWMSGSAIQSEFAGKQLAGRYPSGATWSEAIKSDGSTDYREGSNHWAGQWWIRDREFCFRYAPPGIGGCFRVIQRSANCFELYDYSRPEGSGDEPTGDRERWNGRLWHVDRPTTCEERPIV